MILGIDLSAWNSLKTPYKNLKESGVEFAIVKGDQDVATKNHMALARDAGMIVGEYFWQDVTIPAARQAAAFLEDCKINQPAFVFLDVEMFWKDWDQWYQWTQGKLTLAQVAKVPPATISSNACEVMYILSQALTCPVGMYSAKWFIEGFAPGIATWAANYPFWVMSIISEATHQATWDEIKEGPPAGYEPNMPHGMTTWLMAQWSSGKILPGGTGDRIDLNMFPGTLECFRSWAGLTPPEPPAPTIEQRVTAIEDWIKAHG